MREFKYDVVQLIQCVRDRPCLWDKSLENYKDRVERRAAWEEVFGILDEGYNEMNREEKRLMGEHVLCKWTNIRDTFTKSLKTRMGRPKKKYIFYEHLKFLLKMTGVDYSNSEFTAEEAQTYMKVEKDSPKESSSRKRSKKSVYNENASFKSTQSYDKSSREYYQSDNELIEIEESNDPRIMNEDEAFFASLLPTVVKYSEDERLEFRIEVLSVMRKIKEKRKWSSERMD
ncbi:uncharacterized protein LOC123703495 [Colias croceus]|uniref:uncharacterized protein LOC123703495 n=1 Tax=Colias crocea TaxID=72248 RepID=UPI001E279D88|nr:uncharacterized protein LOC123703495 [Colias croceus]